MTHAHDNAIDPLARAVLDSLDAHVAVIDADGAIVAVNAAWVRFGLENGYAGAEGCMGDNYLEVCEKAARAGEESARAMLRNCRSLLAGRQDHASIEYPCHSPARRRWFVAHMSRFIHDGRPYVSLVHEEITARMLAQEERLLAQQELMRAKGAVDALNRELQAVLEGERVKARTDDLTGLCNRRHFFGVAAQLASVARRYGTPFSIAMVDIDHFKRVNDEYGHQAADAILQCFARAARGQLRESDVIARYGGEEFIVAFPLTDAAEAFAAAEKLRLAAPACGRSGARDAGLTLSVGVAQMTGAAETLEEVIRRADAALYEAKREGRDRTRIAPPAA